MGAAVSDSRLVVFNDHNPSYREIVISSQQWNEKEALESRTQNNHKKYSIGVLTLCVDSLKIEDKLKL